jgi:hypothetical protein
MCRPALLAAAAEPLDPVTWRAGLEGVRHGEAKSMDVYNRSVGVTAGQPREAHQRDLEAEAGAPAAASAAALVGSSRTRWHHPREAPAARQLSNRS